MTILHYIQEWGPWAHSHPHITCHTEVPYCGRDVPWSEKTAYKDETVVFKDMNNAICIDCLYVHKSNIGVLTRKPVGFDIRVAGNECRAMHTDSKLPLIYRGYLRIAKPVGDQPPKQRSVPSLDSSRPKGLGPSSSIFDAGRSIRGTVRTSSSSTTSARRN